MKFDVLVITVGAFRGKNREMVLKQISFVGIDENGEHWKGCYVLGAPYPVSELPRDIQRTNEYISKKMLGNAKWNDGNILYLRWKDLVCDLCRNVSPDGVILVKGSELAKKLREILPAHCTLHDLDKSGCSKAEDIMCTIDDDMECVALCGLPKHNMGVCPMGKCIRYALWWVQRKREQDRMMQVAWAEEHKTLSRGVQELVQRVKHMDLDLKLQAQALKKWERELDEVEQKPHKIAGHILTSGTTATAAAAAASKI
jgi:ferredoxin